MGVVRVIAAAVVVAAGVVASEGSAGLIVRTVAGTGEHVNRAAIDTDDRIIISRNAAAPNRQPLGATPLPDPFAIAATGEDDFAVCLAAPGLVYHRRDGREWFTRPAAGDRAVGEPYDIVRLPASAVPPATVPLGTLVGSSTDVVVDRTGHAVWIVSQIHRDRGGDPLDVASTEAVGGPAPGPARESVLRREVRLRQPHDLCLDGRGGLLVCDTLNHCLRRIDLADRDAPVTIFGTQRWDGHPLRGPRVIVRDDDPANPGGYVIAYRESNRVLSLDAGGTVRELLAGSGRRGRAGDGGPAIEAELGGPKGLAIGPDGTIYIADTENHVIRAIDRTTGQIATLVGDGTKGDGPDGPALQCRLSRPHGIAIAGSLLLIADTGNHRVRGVELGRPAVSD